MLLDSKYHYPNPKVLQSERLFQGLREKEMIVLILMDLSTVKSFPRLRLLSNIIINHSTQLIIDLI